MRVLVAEDEPSSRLRVAESLARIGCEVRSVADGSEAWRVLEQPDSPSLAILDWGMRGLDGLEICRRVRRRVDARYVYIILLTTRCDQEDRLAGLEAGADDFLCKPCSASDLGARVRVGERILHLEGRLDGKIHELETALVDVRRLQGEIPICLRCKSVRADHDTWQRVESSIEDDCEATFTQSLCGRCLEVYYPEEARPGSLPDAPRRQPHPTDLFKDRSLKRSFSPFTPPEKKDAGRRS